ncbi:MAG: hypothetical protein CFE34_05620 [Rhodobacteraceae bacterium PARR1]|nr:MAG: hypothetical protein CFE34_05620 [Rhodobacteraceae bacterium PARR1]
MTRHPVIAISGVPGAGKSRASAVLARRLGAVHLPFDDFETLTQLDPATVQQWLASGAPVAAMFDPALDAVLGDLSRQGTVVFETPMGRMPPAHDALITLSLWLDVDRDVALCRKLDAALNADHWSGADEMAGWIGGFLQGYQALVRPCLDLQAANVRARADHVINGMLPPAAVDSEVARIVQTAISLTATGQGFTAER